VVAGYRINYKDSRCTDMLSMWVDYFRCVFYQKQIISLLLSRVRSLHQLVITLYCLKVLEPKQLEGSRTD
jgi:hypothetical protein